MSTFEGIEASDGHAAVLSLLRTGVPATVDDLRAEVDRFYEITRASLPPVWSTVKAVALALLDHEELTRDGLDAAIGDASVLAPVMAVQRSYVFLPSKTVG